MADSERKHAACKECREKKLKCVPSEDGGDICRRCLRLGKDCQAPEVKQRRRKARLRGRVEQLESSYSEILSLLRQKPQPQPQSQSQSQSQPEATSTVAASTPALTDTSRMSQTATLKSPLPACFVSTLSDVQPSYSVQIPLDECERLLGDYRRMATDHFPYVIIPEAYPAAMLIEERPMLAQAIFIVASCRSLARQRLLKDQFLRDFSERYFVRSERTLDLLQALMVYFGWCHWYAAPVATQVYRLGSLVVSLAIELGLNQKPTSVTQHEMIVGPGSGLQHGNETASSRFGGYEARRAYIGAYVVSVYCLVLFKKPSVLPFTPYLEECANSLTTDPQHNSDTALIYMIRSIRLSEEITLTFDHGSKEMFGELSDEKIHILVKALSKQIEDWRMSLPTNVFEIGRIQRSYYSAVGYLHEVGLYGLLQGQSPSVIRVSIMYECFSGMTKYLSCALDTTLDEMIDWTSLEWRALNFAIMLSAKSSIILNSAYINTEGSQQANWLGKTLDTLCLRVQELHRLTGDKSSYFLKLAHEWANIKMYHQNCISRNISYTSTVTKEQPQSQLVTQAQQQQQQHQTIPASYMDAVFDMDPFSELFWGGFGDAEPGMSGIYQM